MSAVKSRWEQRLKSQIASFISKEPENVANLFLEGTRDISATCARLERK